MAEKRESEKYRRLVSTYMKNPKIQLILVHIEGTCRISCLIQPNCQLYIENLRLPEVVDKLQEAHQEFASDTRQEKLE